MTGPLVLASTSPQRRAILEQLGIPFEVVAPSYEEHDPPGLAPVDAVRAHARGKARSVAGTLPGRVVLGVDTAVTLDGRIYGKPADAHEAHEMLATLAGRFHDVLSGVCLLGQGFEEVADAATRVWFRSAAPSELRRYVDTGEWRSRAGGYAIQGRGALLVEWIDGDYTNVVGLPAGVLGRLLRQHAPDLAGL